MQNNENIFSEIIYQCELASKRLLSIILFYKPMGPNKIIEMYSRVLQKIFFELVKQAGHDYVVMLQTARNLDNTINMLSSYMIKRRKPVNIQRIVQMTIEMVAQNITKEKNATGQ